MIETFKQTERYEAPESWEFSIVVQRVIALSGGSNGMAVDGEENWDVVE